MPLNRRDFLLQTGSGAAAVLAGMRHARAQQGFRPNILFAIADDWSWPHASAYGTSGISTPAVDRVAREGCLFDNAFAAAPQCSPNRAAILTGRNIWQLEEAGTHASIFPKKWPVWPELLEAAGYHTGHTGKGWSPGDWEAGGWDRNPAGPAYNDVAYPKPPRPGIGTTNYAANFEQFLRARPEGAPFCFWYGAKEPHPVYATGTGVSAGKKLEDATVPAFLPDDPVVRGELLDNFLEVEWFDSHLNRMLEQLEAAGELENTIIIVTSDNGISIPGAKANLREFGLHVPLALRWPGVIDAGQRSGALVSAIDLGPTILEAVGLEVPATMTGSSIVEGGLIRSPRGYTAAGRERHTHARFDNLGYPSRAVRTQEYLYIWNMKPDRWPAGDPDKYHDIDEGPTKALMMEQREKYPEHFAQAFARRLEEELYDILKDPACMDNLAASSAHTDTCASLRAKLEALLAEQGDPRLVGPNKDVFESYPRVSAMRPELGGFAERSAYNEKYR